MGVDDHAFLSDVMEQALQYDQLNISELGCFEAIARRYQMVEEMYSAALRDAEAGSGSSDWLDERHIFLGHERSRGHALISPELERHVAGKLQEESSVLKERRKGREERQLARGVVAGDGAAETGAKEPRGRGRGRGRY